MLLKSPFNTYNCRALSKLPDFFQKIKNSRANNRSAHLTVSARLTLYAANGKKGSP
jgi:hypothetical protein